MRSPGRIALLAFVARQSVSDEQPEGPPQSVDRLTQLVNDTGLRIYAWQSTADVPAIPQDWTRRVDAATDALAERHGTAQTAERQSRQIADLLRLTPAAGSRSFRARPPWATS